MAVAKYEEFLKAKSYRAFKKMTENEKQQAALEKEKEPIPTEPVEETKA